MAAAKKQPESGGDTNCRSRPAAGKQKRRTRRALRFVQTNSYLYRALRATRYGHSAPKLSNSPFRAPPRKACHSSGVNRSTGPSGSLLLRRPIVRPGRLATSTQLPLEKLRELLTQLGPESGLSGEFPNIGLPTITSLFVGFYPQNAQSVR